MQLRITSLPGDGIGPEVISQAICVLEEVASGFGHDLNLTKKKLGAPLWRSSEIPCQTRQLRPAWLHKPYCSEPSAIHHLIRILGNFARKRGCCDYARNWERSRIFDPRSIILRWLVARRSARKSSKAPIFSSCASCSEDCILASHARSKAIAASARR